MSKDQPTQSNDDREVISYEMMIARRAVLVAIDRETIEDWLRKETASPEQRLALVNQEMKVLSRCAVEALRTAPDATGIMLELDHLPKQNV